MPGKSSWGLRARVLLGVAATATLTACGAHVGWNLTSTNTGNLRAPAAFTAECTAQGGHEVREVTPEPPSGSCTMPNGDAIACNWGAQTCTTTCQSSPEACEKLRSVGVRPFELKRATPTVPAQT